MNKRFVAQQAMLSMSDCERLCGRWSREIEELASRSGWRPFISERFEVSVGTAINMLVLSTVMSHGFELNGAASWLPGLRNEALLKLGQDFSNWSINEVNEADREFWATLYGNADTVRPRLASLLGCCLASATRELRVHSQNDVERLSNFDVEQGRYGRAPRLTIDAHALAMKVQSVRSGALFTARVVWN